QAGLTEPEVAAFRSAWRDAIVSEQAPSHFAPPDVYRLDPTTQPRESSVYYWLPAELADRVLPLRFTPAPTAVHRPLAVRIGLSAPPTPAPTLGPRPPGVVRFRISGARAQGLAPEVVRRVVQRHLNELRFCYEQMQVTQPGRLVLDGRIDAHGAVSAT